MDSDGSISIVRRHPDRENPTYSVLIQITWIANNKTLALFNKIVECYGGSISRCLKSSNSNFDSWNTDVLKYAISTKKSEKFLNDILPFLQLKREQCRLALRLIKTTQFGKYGSGRPKPKN